jgi:hypothetical protein
MDGKTARDSFGFNPDKVRVDDVTGFLHLDDITSTPAGILPYPEDGGERRYFPPEVLKRDMETFAYTPIALYWHPDGNIIDVDNIEKFRVGTVKAEFSFDKVIRLKGVVEKKEAISEILSRKIGETSAGYKYWDDEKPGENEYGKFDTTIKRIKFNHLIITEAGRAGASAKVGLDSKGGKTMASQRDLSVFDIAGIKLDKETIEFDPESSKSAIDSMDRREGVLTVGIMKLHDDNVKLQSELTSTKETLENSKKAADSMVKKEDLNSLIQETVEVNEVLAKIGADKEVKKTDDLLTRKGVAIKHLTPDAYKALETAENLQNKVAVDSMYTGSVANLSLNKEILEIDQHYHNDLDGNFAGDGFQQSKRPDASLSEIAIQLHVVNR